MISKLFFGRTGHLSSRVIFGSYAISNATQAEADCTLDLLPQFGVNHIDTAGMYGDAEKRIGNWLKRQSGGYFIATKTRKREYRQALEDLSRSLDRLQVDHVDLWQMHGLTNDAGWERAMGPGGTLEAFIEARDKGLARFLGVTGHGAHTPKMHLRSLQRFDFDAVMLPFNYSMMQIPGYAEDFNALQILCAERNTALQTIKSLARRPWGKEPKTCHTYFYEPLLDTAAVEKAVHWVLGNPQVFLISAGDMRLVPDTLAAAARFEARPAEAEMAALSAEYCVQPIWK